jgi:hypothetical protein
MIIIPYGLYYGLQPAIWCHAIVLRLTLDWASHALPKWNCTETLGVRAVIGSKSYARSWLCLLDPRLFRMYTNVFDVAHPLWGHLPVTHNFQFRASWSILRA